MSLTCKCSECGKSAGYFSGWHSPDYNDIEDLFIVGKVEGDAALSYNEQELAGGSYLCRECLKKALPNSYENILKTIDSKNKII